MLPDIRTRTEIARNQRKHMPEETRTGRLEHIIFQNEANSYVVASFYDESDRHSFTGAGRLADPEEEQVYELTGEEVHHPRFGRQFRILTGRRKLPDESEAIIRFLAGKAFPGIGTATARIVVDTLGEDCLEMIRRDASILQRVPGLSKARQEILVQGLLDYAGDSETYIKLLEWGVAPRQIALLQDHYQDVLKVLDENPFRPLYEVNGFGYQSALKLADALNLREDDLRRLDGLLFRNARELSMKTGSTWLSMARMWDSVQGLEPEIFEAALARLETAGALELENGRIYPFGLCSEEKEIARGIANHMFEVDPPDSKDLETRIRQTEFSLGIEYDVRQKDAIREFFSRSVLVLNGGPGTGKTTVVRAILSIARSLYPDMVIQLAAPTGRAAKRLAALSDNDARTIHSLLRWNLEENTFAKGPSDLLECQILIIDESSMIDTHLFASLILALPDDCRLLLIGDEDQLESVGPGRVFQDLIDSGRIPAVHLERIWRQSEGSGIITLAREIRDEETCTWEDGVTYLDLPEERILDAILEDVDPEMDPDRFQVLAPMYKGAAGIEAVNEALQNVFNPPRAGCPELTAGPVTFRNNDKVMLLKNMPDEDVFNGDMGVISGIDSRTRTITVDFGETEVDFSNDFLYYLSHAWCVSVHKAQGSEYDKVYCITSCRNQAMLSKKLLYTAISRAKKELILLGDPGVFRSKVRQKTRNHRMTTLKERLWEYISLQPLESDSDDSRNLENS